MGTLPLKNLKWRLLWPFFLSILTIAILSCDTDKSTKIIAEVETYPITLGEFRERLDNLLLHTTQDNAELHEALLQNLIDILVVEATQASNNIRKAYRLIGRAIRIK